MTDKTTTPATNYTPAQEALIRAMFASKGSALDFADCATLASNPEMNDSDGGARKPRSIAMKISRMADIDYARKVPTTKSGQPVTSKAKLVERIAARVSGNLDGLDKAPKPALEALVAALAA